MPLHLDRGGRHRAADDTPPATGRRLIPAPLRVPADWMPPTPSPAARQTLAPTYYATRRLHAGPNDRTGLLPTISADTRCPR